MVFVLKYLIENSKKVPAIIHLAESYTVLLFTHGLTTHFYNATPPSTPLCMDDRIAWTISKETYDMQWIKCTRLRYTIILMLLHLAHYTQDLQIGKNPLLGLLSNKLWKNEDTMLRSMLGLVFVFENDYSSICVQEEFIKLRSICISYLLLSFNNIVDEKQRETTIGQLYINQKASIMKSKLGLTFSEEAKLLTQNYMRQYMMGLNSDRISIIFTSYKETLRRFVLNLVNKDVDITSERFSFIIQESILLIQLLNYNPLWSSFSEEIGRASCRERVSSPV